MKDALIWMKLLPSREPYLRTTFREGKRKEARKGKFRGISWEMGSEVSWKPRKTRISRKRPCAIICFIDKSIWFYLFPFSSFPLWNGPIKWVTPLSVLSYVWSTLHLCSSTSYLLKSSNWPRVTGNQWIPSETLPQYWENDLRSSLCVC